MNKPKEILELEKIYNIELSEATDTLPKNTYQIDDKDGSIIALNLSDNQLTEIKGLEKFYNLLKLILSYNQIAEIKGLEKLQSLLELHIYKNNIHEIKGLDNLNNLYELDLSDNKIDEINGLEKLINLTELDLSDNQITKIIGVEKLQNLSKLDLSFNQIDEINGLEKLIKLTELDLSDNQITEIKNLNNLNNLSLLDLSYNRIKEIKHVDKLHNLSELYLFNNQINEIEGLDKLVNLSELYLASNQIIEIKGLDKLINLSELNLYNNLINNIKGLDRLKNLSGLDLASNQISEIKGLGKLINLYELDLSDNRIEKIKELGQLHKLSTLILNDNRISNIKEFEKIIILSKLTNINISGNPFLTQNRIHLAEGSNHKNIILNELSKLNDQQTAITYPIKICLLGNHGSGKTKFLNYFFQNKIIEEESTKILKIHPLNTNLDNNNLPDAVFFDFGGQDYYHGIYKAFLTNSSTNLLFWHQETDTNRHGIDNGEGGSETIHYNRQYWLGQLEYAEEFYNYRERKRKSKQTQKKYTDKIQHYACIYQIQTHSDIDSQNIHTHRLTDKYHYITLNKSSLKSDSYRYALQSLKSEIVERINSRKREEKSISEVKLFEYIIRNRATENKLNITHLLEHYNKRANEIHLLRAELEQLSQKGIVLYYKNSEILQDIVWINPEITVEEIHKIFNIQELQKYKGKIPKYTFESKTEDTDLIELLKYNKVIYLDEFNDNQTYIVPSYLNSLKDVSDDFFIFGGFNSFNFSLKFENFIPFGFINQLICKYGGNPEAKSYRKDQLIFTTKNQKAKVLIRIDYQKLLIEIGISSNDKNIKIRQIEQEIFFDLIATYWRIETYSYPESKEEFETEIKTEYNETNNVYISETVFKRKKYKIDTWIDSPPDMFLSIDNYNFIHYETLEDQQNTSNSILSYPITEEGILQKARATSISTKPFSRFSKNPNIQKMKKIFISYSRKDVEYKNELREYLKVLKNFDIADNWNCEEITPGKWHEQIQKELEGSDMIIFMLSNNFFASDYIVLQEVINGIKMAENGPKLILNVIVGEFVGVSDLEIKENSDNAEIQEYLKKISQYQYVPYSKIDNPIQGRKAEKIVPLNDYTAITGRKIDSAYVQIVDKIKEVLK